MDGVEIDLNGPSSITVFNQTFNTQEASDQGGFRILRNVVWLA